MTKNGTKGSGVQALFYLGRVLLTPGALDSIPMREIIRGLESHAQGDWGNLGPVDWAQNELALREGGRLFSAYCTSDGVKFWIITEWDRSRTTVLLPDEY